MKGKLIAEEKINPVMDYLDTAIIELESKAVTSTHHPFFGSVEDKEKHKDFIAEMFDGIRNAIREGIHKHRSMNAIVETIRKEFPEMNKDEGIMDVLSELVKRYGVSHANQASGRNPAVTTINSMNL